MPGVHIVTDSSADLGADDLDGLDVTVVPLSIRFGDDEYTDGRDLTVDQFYARMAATEELPQTACPSPGAFELAFRAAADAGADAVVCLNISEDLSNTVQSARTAAAACGDGPPIHVIDTKTVSSGLGTLVLDAAAAAREGADAPTILERIGGLVARTHVIAALNTLDNLKKGGRIGGARAMVGSLLAIKPVIDLTGGTVHEAGKARTRGRAMQMLLDLMKAAGEITHVAVMDGGAHDVEQFLDLLGPHFPRATLRRGTLGAVIGTHGGAEILGVSWLAGA